VEYVYSTSSPGLSMVVVRYKVGESEEASIVRLNQKLAANFDLVPAGATLPIVKPRSIDDVPILALTLWSSRYGHDTLRSVAAQLREEIKRIADVSEVQIIGGQKDNLKITLDELSLAARGVSAAQLAQSLSRSNSLRRVGEVASGNRQFVIEAGTLLGSAADVGSSVVGTASGRAVYIRDIAQVTEAPEEASDYVLYGERGDVFPAVTISIAKRKGANAIDVAENVLGRIEASKGSVIPDEIHTVVARNYGKTAEDKSNELLLHMLIAIVSVSALILLALGIAESGIVAIAIPVTLSLTLAVFYLLGYTLNRVTLFALIFSIGILVDDAIVVVENIVRHARLPENASRAISDIAIEAVDEVGNPTILATLAVMAAVLPMAFVRGLMGPYMRPIPIGASTAMLFSLLVAFVVTPWASVHLLRRKTSRTHSGEGMTTHLYRRFMGALLRSRAKRIVFLAGVAVLLISALTLVGLRVVRVKMLPFDNKSEFQVIIDTPEGTTLEQTTEVALRIARYIRDTPEVRDYQIYSGTASPYNFNGLVRHYFLRRGANVADIQVNLLPREARRLQSHEIAKGLRPGIQKIAAAAGARVKVAEVPPGPPVLQTVLAEIYGPNYERQIEVARQVRDVFERTEGMTDVDWYVEDDQPRISYQVDVEKAALSGVAASDVAESLKMAVSGSPLGLLHTPESREDIPIVARLGRAERSSTAYLNEIRVAGPSGASVPLGELVNVKEGVVDRSIYHKNLTPVVYVTGDVAGAEESPLYPILDMNRTLDALKLPEGYSMERFVASLPSSTDKISMKWDGEWFISYEVFRDLGIAFAVVLILIYILVTGWFQSFKTPLAIMAAIPFSLVGILPAHGLLGAFFTATSMIGFIAGAGIVVRNSIILVDFIEVRKQQGMSLADAAVDAGAVRFRPMMLTAGAVMVGAGVILFDPIFQGLALSLMAGEVASLLLSRMAVPVLYYLSKRTES
jgi:multidrug efflux pump subunit AcrB